MLISENQIFNLWDTNGRRCDITNALDIYLSFLYSENKRPDFEWATYPNSLSQYNFYKNAILSSPEVFKVHPNFDYLENKYRNEIEQFNNGIKAPLTCALTHEDEITLDKHVEQRARHYSSNLVKMGFATNCRIVSDAGKSFLGIDFNKDELERLLPLKRANIVMLRQLMKLRIYGAPINGVYSFYSPFYAALYLLLQSKVTVDKDMFETMVQSMSPYHQVDIEDLLTEYANHNGDIARLNIKVPSEYLSHAKIPFDVFKNEIKNSKSGEAIKDYYSFYESLYEFNNDNSEPKLKKVLDLFKSRRIKEILKKAFGFGGNIFFEIDSFDSYGMSFFLRQNDGCDLLNADEFNKNFYVRFVKSKYLDSAREYADTTRRMLSSTGLFRFDKAQPVLSFKDILKMIFDLNDVKDRIFGTSSELEYQIYENQQFLENKSFIEILGFNGSEIKDKISSIEKAYDSKGNQLVQKVRDKSNDDFLEHVNSKYTKDVVLTIMRMFSDRSNDPLIQKMVNPEASVPTIYEYITAIAWYYISDKQMNLFDSMNLTMNSEFEPILHAGGGDGDIIVNYQNLVIMLEVTLMDKNSQKRGELEPVLRHSTNLRAKYVNEETLTFFIADELDQSTVITWRLAALAPREAANAAIVDNVRIMSFTNEEICTFIEKGVTTSKIVKETEKLFSTNDFAPGWREKAVRRILAQR